VQENNDFEFRLMVDIYDWDTYSRPLDIDKVGKIKFQMKKFYYDPILNEDVEEDIVLGFHNCYKWEI
jgi:hypothetical protein